MARTAKTISTLAITETSPSRPHKIDAVVELMRRADGASLCEIPEATGCLLHLSLGYTTPAAFAAELDKLWPASTALMR
ncbi:hypothetical protein GVM20_00610 [Porphyrobacter sp. SLTP]|uniref:hypothetical protein n=1 Tax=Porphyrobacter sp. SLTP TaxID=2683266 RepID=UPI0014124486|nr:hypothetical protein [Porphyrobacter sp. SLTP]NBB23624.1 hypothetical protein [Porphyrobacter sp. SLTP]